MMNMEFANLPLIICGVTLLHFSTFVLGQYCKIPLASMLVVDSCPESRATWTRQSLKKNCTSFSNQFNCSQADTYIYHCLINHFSNVTTEVCAPEAYINFGHCAEYNIKGQIIQSNFNAKCQQCPKRYLSSEAYKYQECYNMTKVHEEESTTAVNVEITSHSSSTTNISCCTVTPTPSCRKWLIPSLVAGVLLPVSSIAVLICVFKRNSCLSCIEVEKTVKDPEKSRGPVVASNSSYTDGSRSPTAGMQEESTELLTSGQQFEHQRVTKGFHSIIAEQNRSSCVGTDEDEELPDISVRDKHRYLDDDQEEERLKRATQNLNKGMLNLAFDIEEEEDALKILLQDDLYRNVMTDFESCYNAQFTSEKAPLLESYAEQIQGFRQYGRRT